MRISRQQILDEMAAEISACTRCGLCQTRTRAVPGDGPTTARIMFVGEGPGASEDAQGLPFVGPAGKFLDELLAEAGLERDNVFITNIVKCRPPGNRAPNPDEVAACRDYLNGQIALIYPRVICTLGRPAMNALIDPAASIGREHGRPREIDTMLYIPLYHPAAALHRASLRPELVDDMRSLKVILQGFLS